LLYHTPRGQKFKSICDETLRSNPENFHSVKKMFYHFIYCEHVK
jgi:hypothetical protein